MHRFERHEWAVVLGGSSGFGLATAHVLAALGQTVPLAKTMSEKISAQRHWANGRARIASIVRPEKPEEEMRRMEL